MTEQQAARRAPERLEGAWVVAQRPAEGLALWWCRLALACSGAQGPLSPGLCAQGPLTGTQMGGQQPVEAPLSRNPKVPGARAVSYTHLTLPTTGSLCRSRWSPYH